MFIRLVVISWSLRCVCILKPKYFLYRSILFTSQRGLELLRDVIDYVIKQYGGRYVSFSIQCSFSVSKMNKSIHLSDSTPFILFCPSIPNIEYCVGNIVHYTIGSCSNKWELPFPDNRILMIVLFYRIALFCCYYFKHLFFVYRFHIS